MSEDNYNMIVQRADGKWVASPNHSMTELMEYEEKRAYNHAYDMLRADDPVFDSQGEAYDAMDENRAEYGTFSHEYRDWFNG